MWGHSITNIILNYMKFELEQGTIYCVVGYYILCCRLRPKELFEM